MIERSYWQVHTPWHVNEGGASLVEVDVEKAPVVWPAGRHHHVVDRGRRVTEEAVEGSRDP